MAAAALEIDQPQAESRVEGRDGVMARPRVPVPTPSEWTGPYYMQVLAMALAMKRDMPNTALDGWTARIISATSLCTNPAEHRSALYKWMQAETGDLVSISAWIRATGANRSTFDRHVLSACDQIARALNEEGFPVSVTSTWPPLDSGETAARPIPGQQA